MLTWKFGKQALSWLFVCLRLIVRLAVARIPGWDDLFVFLYLVRPSPALEGCNIELTWSSQKIFTTVASVVFLLCEKSNGFGCAPALDRH
jgi:hypothetical protein